MASIRQVGAILLTGVMTMLPHAAKGQSESLEVRPVDTDSSYVCVLKSEDVDALHFVDRPLTSHTAGKTSAVIQINFVNESGSDPWPESAKNAVNYAASIWGGIVNSQIAVRIEATWVDLGSCDGSQFALASAGPQFIYRNFRNAPRQDTWYPDALADAVHGADLGAGKIDILSRFNRRCGPAGSGKWYFGTDARPPSGTIDMVSVALHEFAHGLGIFGSADVDDGQSSNGRECNGTDGAGCIGTGDGNNPLTYDRFTEDGNGVPLLSLSNPSEVLGTALEGGRAGGIFFSGPRLASAGFDRARLYAPSTFNAGASYAHVDENTYNRTSEALMTPFLARAEAIHVPGTLVCGMLADLGWTITADCSQSATTAQVDEITPQSMQVTGPYPNPLDGQATLTVSTPVDVQLAVEVHDALGRLVERLHRGVLPSNGTHRFTLDGGSYVPGVYLLTISSPFGTFTKTFVVAR